MKTRYILVILLLCIAAVTAYIPREVFAPDSKPLQSFPNNIGQWRSWNNTMLDEATLRVLRASDYMMRTYATPKGEQVNIYVGFHNGGKDSGPIHSPRNCLPGSGWLMTDDRVMQMEVAGQNVNMVRAVFAKGQQTMTCYYWYQVRDKTITSDFALKMSEFTGMILNRRKDASFIRLDIPGKPSEQTDALINNFLEQFYPVLREYLPS